MYVYIYVCLYMYICYMLYIYNVYYMSASILSDLSDSFKKQRYMKELFIKSDELLILLTKDCIKFKLQQSSIQGDL